MTTIERIQKVDYANVLIWLGIALMVIWIIAKIAGISFKAGQTGFTGETYKK